jgi:nucleotide-binding universal stress UspA family protein
MSYPFKKILCPVQFEDSEQTALALAVQMAKDMNATVYLLHIVQNMQAIDAPDNAAGAADVEHEARLKLQKMADEMLAGLKSESLTRLAAPAETSRVLLEAAAQIDADLIVLKTHGRHGLAHFIMGSVAEQVVRRARCPVLTLTSTD